MRTALSLAALAGVAATSFTQLATASVTIVQQTAAAPTYATTLNFDEPGQPTGQVPSNTWVPGFGLDIAGNAGDPVVADWSGIFGPWAGTGNAAAADGGLFLTFDQPLTSLSFQMWDASGAPGPFGGGVFVAAKQGGPNGTIVAGVSVTPAWNGSGNTWYNITTTDGSTFDYLALAANGFATTTIIDNLSWNTIPGPGAFGLLALGGLVGGRRRSSK